MLGMMTQAQVSGTELKVRVEKALNEKSLKKLVTNLEKELDGEHSFLPHEVETQIRREITSAGVTVSQHGGWYLASQRTCCSLRLRSFCRSKAWAVSKT